MNPNPDAVDAYGRCRIEDQPECHRSGYHVPPSRPATTTVSTSTGFPGFAPGEHRRLLAEVSGWARTNGWTTHRDTGWQNPSRLTQVDWDERGLHIGSRNSVDHVWKTPRHWPADSVRQAVDILVALDILPAGFSSAHKEGREQAAIEILGMSIDLGDAGWRHLEARAVAADYPVEAVRRRRTRDDFTTATIEAAYQYGYRQAAKVARVEVAR